MCLIVAYEHENGGGTTHISTQVGLAQVQQKIYGCRPIIIKKWVKKSLGLFFGKIMTIFMICMMVHTGNIYLVSDWTTNEEKHMN